MSQQVKVTRYSTMEEAAKAGDFYAINTSDASGTRARGKLILGIKNPDGNDTKIMIPPTWIPIDLAGYASPDILRNASIIREYMRKSAIILVDKATFVGLQKHPKYAEEFARVSKMMGGFAAGIKEEFSIAVGASTTMVEPDSPAAAARASIITDGILQANSDEEMISKFNAALPGLQIEDYRYLALKSINGSLVQHLAMELESALVAGQISEIKTIEETEAYKTFLKTGRGSEPVITF